MGAERQEAVNNFVLVGGVVPPTRRIIGLGGALVSPEAPPPPAITESPAPMKAWEEPKPEQPPLSHVGRRPTGITVYALVFESPDGDRWLVGFETEEERTEEYHAFLDLFRHEDDTHPLTWDELEERYREEQYEVGGSIAFAEFELGASHWRFRKLEMLKAHFARQIGKMNGRKRK